MAVAQGEQSTNTLAQERCPPSELLRHGGLLDHATGHPVLDQESIVVHPKPVRPVGVPGRAVDGDVLGMPFVSRREERVHVLTKGRGQSKGIAQHVVALGCRRRAHGQIIVNDEAQPRAQGLDVATTSIGGLQEGGERGLVGNDDTTVGTGSLQCGQQRVDRHADLTAVDAGCMVPADFLEKFKYHQESTFKYLTS